ncbi:hypothetical protein [Hanstruepera marina]|uniref:hypothetical protein n=1 Tax=Hanstruepera marina TaxID=2873265 RepID=UPI001CA76C6F|nr:hypothetical protein [Hanstruepera marina]
MKVKSVLVLLIFTLVYTTAFSQKKITWKELSTAYRNELFPKESDDKNTLSLKDIEGKEVTVRGYFLDLGADSMWYMLSRFPFENCFFCTGVGPETVIELGEFKNEKSEFKTDDIVIVTGTLYLMEVDGEYFYILNNCTVKLFES